MLNEEGCDASILLDGSLSEKTTPPNLSVRGYDIIDQAKAIMEKICARVVSYADIIFIAIFLVQSFLLKIENKK